MVLRDTRNTVLVDNEAMVLDDTIKKWYCEIMKP